MNYYSHHLGDYAKDTGQLSATEHGIYRLLMDAYYSTEEPIPQDEAYRTCRAMADFEKAAADYVLKKYFILRDGRYYHKRVEAELVKMREIRNRSKENGRKGGRPSKEPRPNPEETQRVISGIPRVNPEETQSQSPHYPLPITQEPKNSAREENCAFDKLELFDLDSSQQTQSKAPKLSVPPSVEKALHQLFRHRPSTRWTEKEVRSSRGIKHIPEEELLDHVALFQEARDKGWEYYRRNAETLFNNWESEITKAEDFLNQLAASKTQRPAFATA